MRKNLVVALCLAAILAAASTTAFAAAYSDAGTGVTGSRHDINRVATNIASVSQDAQERVCAFCHTPHHAFVPGITSNTNATDYLPLWSHEVTTRNFVGYASPTLQATNDGRDLLIGPSRLCMSCHDGVIAVDTHYGLYLDKQRQLSGDNFSDDPTQSGAVGLGGDLAGDHPIGFDYIDARSLDKTAGGTLATGINDENSQFRKVATGGGAAFTGIVIKDVLFKGSKGQNRIMTCATCHDVHNKDNVAQKTAAGGDMGVNYFLYGSQSGSQICLSCHNK